MYWTGVSETVVPLPPSTKLKVRNVKVIDTSQETPSRGSNIGELGAIQQVAAEFGGV